MWKYEKETKDFVWSGAETGIAPSPHKGTANLQNVNINTETGEVMCSFPRTAQTRTPYTGILVTYAANDRVLVTGLTFLLVVGDVVVLTSGVGATPGNYYIQNVISGSIGSQVVQFSLTYSGAAITSFSAGTATIGSFNLNTPVGRATENYFDGTNLQYRYYIVDNKGQVWMNDTGTQWSSAPWTPLDIQTSLPSAAFNWGVGVYQGYVHLFSVKNIFVMETSKLGVWIQSNLALNGQNVTQPHFVLTGHQASMNYTDSNFVGQIQGNSVTTANLINNWTYGVYTVSGNILTVDHLIGGDFPLVGQKITFTASTSVDSAIVVNRVYYVIAANYSTGSSTFEISATIGGSTIAWNHDAVGTQYFNSYNPGMTGGAVATDSNGVSTLTFTPQACTLPPNEIAISLGEVGNLLVIGCRGNVLYSWDEQHSAPDGIINIPENNASYIISVNNMAYVFAGNKGNIYITNGSTASPVISVPDYCAGVPGSPATYVEPYFTWGGADYIRGRVYFSILDQTSTKAGNCGGIWSFVPTQNLFIGQDTGLALRLENTNSVATLNGYAPVILANQNQAAVGVQYFSAWVSAYNYPSAGTAGIDTSGTAPTVTAKIETDFLPSGTYLGKRSFAQQEYKLASPLLSGESVQLYYRITPTDAWTTCGSVVAETSSLSGYFTAAFQNTQWLQLQAQLVPNGTATFSGNRLTELRLR